MKKTKTQKGITLIALIITVVVLLILAAVTINEIQGNGIIEYARTARENYNKSRIIEEIALEIFNKKLENLGSLNETEFEEILVKYGTVTEDGTTLITTEGNYEILISDIYNGELDSGLVTTPLSSWEYSISGSDIILTKYIGSNEKIFVPGTLNVDNTVYNVKISAINYNTMETPFLNNTIIKEVKFADSINMSTTTGLRLFMGCTNLKTVYNIPSNIVNAQEIFSGCTSLISVPVIPANVTNLNQAFRSCSSLSGIVIINATNLNSATDCFNGTKNKIVLRVDSNSTTYEVLESQLGNWLNVCFEGEDIIEIACWGDSLTVGDGGNASRYPSILKKSNSLQLNVYEFGIAAEESRSIAIRQGGISIYTNAFKIPSGTDRVEIEIKDEDGNDVVLARKSYTYGLNPCYINNIKGSISYDSTTSKYYFTRAEEGSIINVSNGTQVITDAMKNHRDDLMVIWSGSNDIPNSTTIQDVIHNINAMIEYSNNPNYIVIGLTSKYITDIEQVNKKLSETYGEHFLDIRTYILENGLADAEIEATEQDTTDIANGQIPTSLRSDGIHFNEAGYTLVGQQVYNKLVQLGYLN